MDIEVRKPADAERYRVEREAEARRNAEIFEAEAFGRYNEAAVLQMLVEILPQVAKEIAAPVGAIDKLTVVSTDGAAALPRQVTDNLTQTLELIGNTTGLDLQALLRRFSTEATTPSGAVPGGATQRATANGGQPSLNGQSAA